MTARIVEVIAKRGRTQEVCRIAEQKVLPLVRRLDGFLGKWTLVAQDEPRRIVFFSFWTTPAAVAEYQRSLYPKVLELVAPLIKTVPVARVFEVRNGTPLNCL